MRCNKGETQLPDAIHLASAQWLAQFAPDDLAFHTYNTQDYQKFASLVPFPISEPITPAIIASIAQLFPRVTRSAGYSAPGGSLPRP